MHNYISWIQPSHLHFHFNSSGAGRVLTWTGVAKKEQAGFGTGCLSKNSKGGGKRITVAAASGGGPGIEHVPGFIAHTFSIVHSKHFLERVIETLLPSKCFAPEGVRLRLNPTTSKSLWKTSSISQNRGRGRGGSFMSGIWFVIIIEKRNVMLALLSLTKCLFRGF